MSIGLARRMDGRRRKCGHRFSPAASTESCVGTKKTGKGRRKLGQKKRRMRSKIRHRKR